jgi:hypothetical protein
MGDLHLAARPVEKHRAELVLQRFDLHAEGRLADVEPFGGAAEAELLGNGNKIAQLAKFHVLYTNQINRRSRSY